MGRGIHSSSKLWAARWSRCHLRSMNSRTRKAVCLRCASDSLTNAWTNIWTSATNAYGGGTNTFEIITVTDPVPSENVSSGRFLRLNVTRP